MNRRDALRTGGLLALGGAVGTSAGCTADARGSEEGEPPLAVQVPRTTIPVLGREERFPVRRIYCIGRNYAAHAIEMVQTPRGSRPSSSRRPRTPFRSRLPGRSWTILILP